ncbi:MAG: HipA domain-containing protein [Lautropia sp.]|nr:HipA domain-containing protein [Lautropia sp.]
MKQPQQLAVQLAGQLVGYLSHDANERTRFDISEAYIDLGPSRPVLSLSMVRPGNEAHTLALLRDERHRSAHVKAPPFFSNLLPEGALRARIARQLKVHEDREFLLLAALGHDLPGAIELLPADRLSEQSAPHTDTTAPSAIHGSAASRTHAPYPDHDHALAASAAPEASASMLSDQTAKKSGETKSAQATLTSPTTTTDAPLSLTMTDDPALRFSLGGMQLKFSMLRQGQRYTLHTAGALGDYIVKPPSVDFPALPRVEAAMIATARAVGIEVPEVFLVSADKIDGLPALPSYLADEPFYAIRRFDRHQGERVHIEDFAQVFNLRPSQKYNRANHDMIAATLLRHAGGIKDLEEMSRRLVLNVLLGNGDAHLKNWSLIYDDPQRPRLAPAYDLVSTVAYSQQDTTMALNLSGVRAFANITLDTFARLFTRIGLSDHSQASLLETVRITARQVNDAWQDVFLKTDVPTPLIQRIETHIKAMPLARV